MLVVERTEYKIQRLMSPVSFERREKKRKGKGERRDVVRIFKIPSPSPNRSVVEQPLTGKKPLGPNREG